MDRKERWTSHPGGLSRALFPAGISRDGSSVWHRGPTGALAVLAQVPFDL